ncbi:hypothetical protein [Photorhabdus namnaonensis]|uniref:Uncharacterized protein n=1 Tax=Photorhabdus namnaonensis TaxID=1851568 RepID=A0A1B8YFA2_9GAMM|nr:hypothetical protein [Photorhabdus namnaonensis]OCA53833.1 hypothetical protein Phpb_03159 [Photorhabdus namnaonensis]
MTHKRYNPSWEGYMGDFLRGHIGINHLKPQDQSFDTIGLEKQLNENTAYIALLSLEEAKFVLEEIDSPTPKSPFINTLWISRCIAAARERIPGSIDNYVTGVSECSQQRSNLKDDG